MKLKLSLLFFILTMLAATAFAAGTTVTINQIMQQDRDIHVFFDVCDENGNPVALSGAELSASINGNDLTSTTDVTAVNSVGEGTAYCLVLDMSRSMGTENFNTLMSGVKSIVSSLHAEDSMSVLVLKGSGVQVVCDAAKDRSQLLSAIENIKRTTKSESAPMYDALLQAAVRVSRVSSPAHRAVLAFVNGNTVDQSVQTSQQELTRLVDELSIPIYVCGYGATGDMLSGVAQLARQSGGAYLQAADASEALNVLSRLQVRMTGGYHAVFSAEDFALSGSSLDFLLTVYNSSGTYNANRSVMMRIEATPTPIPTATPTAKPTAAPTATPTAAPTAEPTAEPTATPTAAPTAEPTATPEPTPVPFMERQVAGIPLVVLLAGAGVLAVIVIIAIVLVSRKPKTEEEDEPSDSTDDLSKTVKAGSALQQGDLTKTVKIGAASGKTVQFSYTENGKKVNRSLAVGASFCIGRDPACELCLSDDRVSGHHAYLAFVGNQLMLRDNHSTNGTIYNGSMLGEKPVALRSGDSFQVGLTFITIRY